MKLSMIKMRVWFLVFSCPHEVAWDDFVAFDWCTLLKNAITLLLRAIQFTKMLNNLLCAVHKILPLEAFALGLIFYVATCTYLFNPIYERQNSVEIKTKE